MESTNGIPLSIYGDAKWRGKNKTNGQLMPVRDYYLEAGYSRLVVGTALQAELTAAGADGVPFGNGVWYNRNLLSTEPNVVHAGIPTAVGAVPKLAGVLKYDAGLATSQPVSYGVTSRNSGIIVKRGLLRYKTGKVAVAGAQIAFSAIDDATMVMFLENSTGDPIFAAPTAITNGVPVLANATFAGYIVHRFVEDQSVLVELAFK